MEKKTGWIIGGVAVAIIGLGAIAATAAGDRGWYKGYGPMKGMGGPLTRICALKEGEMSSRVLGRIENRIKPTAEQAESWAGLQSAFKDAEVKLRTACTGLDAVQTPPDRLARLETALGAAHEAVKTVRPAAEVFYNDLNEEQKEIVAEMRPGRHHGKWRGHWRGRWDDDRDYRDDDRGYGGGVQ